MLILCLLFILNHGFGNWVRSSSFCVFLLLSLLLFFLGLLSLGSVLASSTAENSSKEPKNGSSNGAVAADADATAAGTHARLKNQENKRLEDAGSDAKEAYEAEGILPEAAASGKDVKEPDAESKRQTSRTDASSGLQLLVALNAFDAPVDAAALFFVAPQPEVVDAKPVEGVGIVNADQIAPSVGKDG